MFVVNAAFESSAVYRLKSTLVSASDCLASKGLPSAVMGGRRGEREGREVGRGEREGKRGRGREGGEDREGREGGRGEREGWLTLHTRMTLTYIV